MTCPHPLFPKPCRPALSHTSSFASISGQRTVNALGVGPRCAWQGCILKPQQLGHALGVVPKRIRACSLHGRAGLALHLESAGKGDRCRAGTVGMQYNTTHALSGAQGAGVQGTSWQHCCRTNRTNTAARQRAHTVRGFILGNGGIAASILLQDLSLMLHTAITHQYPAGEATHNISARVTPGAQHMVVDQPAGHPVLQMPVQIPRNAGPLTCSDTGCAQPWCHRAS